MVEGLITGALVCSPAVMFGVERGNVDLFIFSLVAAALVLARRSAPAAFVYVPLVAAAILKLYPAAAFCISLREPTWKRRLTAFAVLALSFGVYVFSQRNDLAKITSNTLKSTYNSFGAIVIFAMTRRAWFPDSDVAWRILRIAAYAAAAGAVAAAFRIARYTVCPPEANRPALDSFRAGASIYVAGFAVGYNWDYRLMFLLLTLPQLFAWVKAGTRWGLISAGAVIVMVTALWISSWSPQMAALDELGNWMLFIYFLVGLLITTPQELFRYLQRGVWRGNRWLT